MNRIYRTVFNISLGQLQVTSELARTHGRKPSSGGATRKTPTSCSTRQPGLLALAIACVLASAGTWAAPGDGGGSYHSNESRGGSSGQAGASPLLGGAPGSGGSAGLTDNSGTVTINTADSILGSNGGDGGGGGWPGGGGGGGIGVVMASGGTLTNQGSISGGNGGNGGEGYTGSSLTRGGGGGGGGHGVSGGNLTLTNAGTINAGLGGNAGGGGAQNGSAGAAVQLTSGTNSLTLQTGSVINGVIWLMDNTSATITAENAGLSLGGGVLLNNGSALTVETPEDLSIGAITGAGSLSKIGGGNLTLSDNNSYTGGTTVSAGTLTGSASSFGSGAITNNASLVLNQASDATLANAISGTGSLSKTGSGNLTLSGSNSYTGGTTVSAGTLTGSASSFGSGAITNNASLVLNQASDATLANAISGTGSLSKTGSGNLTLSGNNSYTGGTTVSAGTLTGSASSFGSGAITNNAALVLDQASDATLANAISGTGSLSKTGGGNLTLSGTNSYSGPTTVSTGTLQAGNSGAFSSASAVTVNSGATLALNNFNQSIGSLAGAGTVSLGSATLTTGGNNISTSFSGSINGSGGLTKNGTGNLTLSGVNTYSGGTTLNAGTLLAGSTGALSGGSAVTVNSGATLDLNNFNQSIGSLAGAGTISLGSATLTTGSDNTSTSFSGTINGSGGLTKNGTGNLTLSGANTYSGGTTLNTGTLTLGHSQALGTGNLTVASGASLDLGGYGQFIGGLGGVGDIALGTGSLEVGGNDSSTFSGGISGQTGSTLTKSGSGTLVLEGNANTVDTSNVTNGSLIVGGSAGSSATLTGTTVNVAGGARLGGHGSITATVILSSGATLAPGNSIGTLTINGNATFHSGSTLEIETNPDGSADRLIVNGNLDLGGSTLKVLAGNGSWSPTTRYTIVSSSNPIAGTFGNVTSNLAFLTPTLDYSLGNSVALTLARNDVSYASVAVTPNQRGVASTLDGNNTGRLAVAVSGLSVAQARAAYDSLSGELHASARSALFDDSFQVRESITDRLRSDMDDNVLHRDAESGLTFWLKGYGNWSDKDGNRNVADLDRDSRGTLLGFDLPLNETWRLGIAAGYGSSDLDIGARDSSADIDSTSLAAYIGGEWDALNLRMGVARTWNQVDSKRQVHIGSLHETLKADYDADTTQVFGELGYALRLGELTLEPFAGVAHVEIDSDGFRERGGDAALSGNGEHEHITYASLGLNASAPLGRVAGMPLDLRAGLAWQHAFDTPDDTYALRLAGYDSFTVEGLSVAENSALTQLAVNLRLAPQASLDLGYSGQFGDGNNSHGVRLGLNIAF